MVLLAIVLGVRNTLILPNMPSKLCQAWEICDNNGFSLISGLAYP